MRIFIDTNIISEFLEERAQVDLVDHIFEAAEQRGWQRVLSVGSFYTITYLTERFLRHQGIGQPRLVEQQRIILEKLLQVFEIQSSSKDSLIAAIANNSFLDLEDSYQYHCAIDAKCDVLLTINKKDFKGIDDSAVQIMTPSEFIDTFIQ